MMEMDDRECAKCKKSKRRDIDVILEILNEENDKIMQSVILFKLKKGQKREGDKREMQWLWLVRF